MSLSSQWLSHRKSGDETYSEVDDAVVQASVKKYTLVLHVLVGGDISLGAVGILDGEWQTAIQTGDEVDLTNTSVDVLRM